MATPERVDTTIEKHHDSVKSNGVAPVGEDGSVSNLENKKEEHGGQECKEVKSPKSPGSANLGSEKARNVKERATERESDTTSGFDDTKLAAGDASERESDTTSDSEAKTLKQSARKGDGTSKSSGGSLEQSEANRKKGSGKSISGKTVKKLSGDDDKKEATPLLKPTLNTTQDEKILDKNTTPVSKRKQTPSKEKESETKNFDETSIGLKIKVRWPKDCIDHSKLRSDNPEVCLLCGLVLKGLLSSFAR